MGSPIFLGSKISCLRHPGYADGQAARDRIEIEEHEEYSSHHEVPMDHAQAGLQA